MGSGGVKASKGVDMIVALIIILFIRHGIIQLSLLLLLLHFIRRLFCRCLQCGLKSCGVGLDFIL